MCPQVWEVGNPSRGVEPAGALWPVGICSLLLPSGTGVSQLYFHCCPMYSVPQVSAGSCQETCSPSLEWLGCSSSTQRGGDRCLGSEEFWPLG